MFSYSISDFVAFDKAVWLSMVGQYMVKWWWVAVLATAALLLYTVRWAASPSARTPGPVFLVLSVCWLWVAWEFHWHEHRVLNWAAGYWALAFVAQAVLLALVAALVRPGSHDDNIGLIDTVSHLRLSSVLAIVVGALLLPGLLAWSVDGAYPPGFEWFGLTPDATAVMTILIVALWWDGSVWLRVLLSVLPVSSLLIATLLSTGLAIYTTGIMMAATGLTVIFIARASRLSATPRVVAG
ncbi:MAG: hypothetical protein AB8C46_03450 [Burkholderiaceae bacterium]